MINCPPKLGGQFELESGGQFAPKLVVNLTGFSTKHHDLTDETQVIISQKLKHLGFYKM
jgi:hypothetical protein